MKLGVRADSVLIAENIVRCTCISSVHIRTAWQSRYKIERNLGCFGSPAAACRSFQVQEDDFSRPESSASRR